MGLLSEGVYNRERKSASKQALVMLIIICLYLLVFKKLSFKTSQYIEGLIEFILIHLEGLGEG